MLIGIDLDNVLTDYYKEFLDYVNNKHATAYKFSDLKSYWFEDNFGGTREEAIKKFIDFEESHSLKLTPVPGAVKAMKNLSKEHELVIITSRRDEKFEAAREWVEKNFPNCFKEIVISTGGAKTLLAQRKSKAQVCKDLGIAVLIEDVLEVAAECAKTSKVLLLDRPWNQAPTPEGVYRVKSWPEALERISLTSLV